MELTRWHVLAGLAVVLVFAAIAIGVFSYFGGSSLSKGDQNFEAPPPLGPVPTVGRSEAADLLSNKSFSDMTPDELILVKGAVAKAYDNAQFRTTSSLAPVGVDIFRIDGVTRVSRQYQVTGTPGGQIELQETLLFYCDDLSGKMNSYRYTITSLGVKTKGEQLPADQLPFGNTIKGLEWSQPEDLGYKTIGGRRVHGVRLPFTVSVNSQLISSENWFDVENARLIARRSIMPDNPDSVLRTFDWRQPQPVVIPAGEPPAPCSQAFYNRAPSARPSPTAVPEATATATP